MIFNFDFAINSMLSRFFFFFLIIDLYILNPAALAKILNPIAELAIPTGIPSKEAKAEIEIHTVTAEAKVRKCSA